jgi:hypothetical protein
MALTAGVAEADSIGDEDVGGAGEGELVEPQATRTTSPSIVVIACPTDLTARGA